MKKVLRTIPEQSFTLIDQVSEGKYYGVNINYKSFIQQEGYCSGNFILKSSNKLTIGNYYDGQTYTGHKTINSLISSILSRGYEVYEFDTPEELFAWLAKKD